MAVISNKCVYTEYPLRTTGCLTKVLRCSATLIIPEQWSCIWQRVFAENTLQSLLSRYEFIFLFAVLWPRHSIDLDVLNVEYGMFVVIFYWQEQWKKSKQIFKVRHGQIDDIPRSLIYLLFLLLFFFRYSWQLLKLVRPKRSTSSMVLKMMCG